MQKLIEKLGLAAAHAAMPVGQLVGCEGRFGNHATAIVSGYGALPEPVIESLNGECYDEHYLTEVHRWTGYNNYEGRLSD